MRQIFAFLSSFALVLLGVCSLLLVTGCEEATGLGGLEVDPAAASLTVAGESVVLTVVAESTSRDLALPLTWSVSDPKLGRIIANSGYTGVYRRSSPDGANTVIVRDQLGNEGFASISQQSEAPEE